MKPLRRVGILGGMGPQATVLLQQRIIEAVSAADDADHIPLIIHMNSQVPSRIDWIIKGCGVDPAPTLAGMARELANAGAEALAMPCNTAHHFASAISGAVDIPLLHMVEAAALNAAKLIGADGKVGILASPATQDIKLFHNTFSQFDIVPVFPERQDLLLQAIQTIKSDGDSEAARKVLQSAAADCKAQGAACLMVGCSEFSIIADALSGLPSGDLPVIDTVDVLVAEIVKFSGAKLRT